MSNMSVRSGGMPQSIQSELTKQALAPTPKRMALANITNKANLTTRTQPNILLDKSTSIQNKVEGASQRRQVVASCQKPIIVRQQDTVATSEVKATPSTKSKFASQSNLEWQVYPDIEFCHGSSNPEPYDYSSLDEETIYDTFRAGAPLRDPVALIFNQVDHLEPVFEGNDATNQLHYILPSPSASPHSIKSNTNKHIQNHFYPNQVPPCRHSALVPPPIQHKKKPSIISSNQSVSKAINKSSHELQSKAHRELKFDMEAELSMILGSDDLDSDVDKESYAALSHL